MKTIQEILGRWGAEDEEEEVPEAAIAEAAPVAEVARVRSLPPPRRDYGVEARELEAAQDADRRRHYMDSASDALYTAFARRPAPSRGSTPGDADNLIKQFALRRQGEADAASAYKATEAANARKLDRAALEKVLNLPEGSLANVSDHSLTGLLATKRSGEGNATREKLGEAQITARQNESDEDRAFREAQAEKERQLKRELEAQRGQRAAAAAEARAAKEKEKAEGKAAGVAKGNFLEGYELRPDAQPQETEIRMARGAQGSTRSIERVIGKIRALYNTHGTKVLPSEARARMEALATELYASMKGPDQYALGVLAGPDMALLQKTIPEPTGAQATILDFFSGDQNVLARYDELGSQVRARFEDRVRSFGYVPAGAKPQGQAAPAGRVTSAKIVKNGKTYVQTADGGWEEEE